MWSLIKAQTHPGVHERHYGEDVLSLSIFPPWKEAEDSKQNTNTQIKVRGWGAFTVFLSSRLGTYLEKVSVFFFISHISFFFLLAGHQVTNFKQHYTQTSINTVVINNYCIDGLSRVDFSCSTNLIIVIMIQVFFVLLNLYNRAFRAPFLIMSSFNCQ